MPHTLLGRRGPQGSFCSLWAQVVERVDAVRVDGGELAGRLSG